MIALTRDLHRSLTRLAAIALLFLISLAPSHANESMKTTPSDDFIAGMRHELDGRATMAGTAELLAERLEGTPEQIYWASYARLEAFNRTRYDPAITALGLESARPNATWIGIKTRLFAWLPRFILPTIIGSIRKATVPYVDKLRHLGTLGPPEHKAFFDYMVRQELVQLDMMAAALREDYAAAAKLADEFIATEQSKAT